MPYIKKEDRKRFDALIDVLAEKEISVGELNYIISRIVWKLWSKNKSYTLANNLIGVLECVKSEFYRRMLAPYEDEKIEENGDVIL